MNVALSLNTRVHPHIPHNPPQTRSPMQRSLRRIHITHIEAQVTIAKVVLSFAAQLLLSYHIRLLTTVPRRTITRRLPPLSIHIATRLSRTSDGVVVMEVRFPCPSSPLTSQCCRGFALWILTFPCSVFRVSASRASLNPTSLSSVMGESLSIGACLRCILLHRQCFRFLDSALLESSRLAWKTSKTAGSLSLGT